jgi:hypothetical protein
MGATPFETLAAEIEGWLDALEPTTTPYSPLLLPFPTSLSRLRTQLCTQGSCHRTDGPTPLILPSAKSREVGDKETGESGQGRVRGYSDER